MVIFCRKCEAPGASPRTTRPGVMRGLLKDPQSLHAPDNTTSQVYILACSLELNFIPLLDRLMGGEKTRACVRVLRQPYQ